MRFQTTAFFSFSLFLLTSVPCARAQDIDPHRCFSGEHYRELLTLFDRWNQKELQLQKTSFEGEFERYIDSQAPGHDRTWATARKRAWSQLPSQLRYAIPLSGGAQMLMLSCYSENAAAFIEQTKDAGERTHILQLKLYFILSIAQDSASKANHEQIQPSDVFVAAERGWTGLWPFCPRTAAK